MKKRVYVVLLTIFSLFLLTSCGSSNSIANIGSDTIESLGGTYKGADYSSTNITGDQADYSYSFSAKGDTNKSKEEMLADYERIQSLVDSLGGYISNVNNDYTYYDTDDDYYSDYQIRNKATGRIEFTAEVDNENIPEVVELLNTICNENHFTVTGYTQRITNYKAYTVTDETDDWNDTITEDELNKRLEYADISVSINYDIPRAIPMRIIMNIKNILDQLWDMIGAIITFFLALAFGLIILYIQMIFFYKFFKKMIYKYRKRYPEYYKNEQHVILHKEEDFD